MGLIARLDVDSAKAGPLLYLLFRPVALTLFLLFVLCGIFFVPFVLGNF